MAKTPGLSQALKAVKTLQRQMGKESQADYGVAASASAAGQANLRTQTRALTRDLLAAQTGANASLSRIARSGRQQTARVAQAEGNATTRYGSALGASVASQFRPAAAVAKATGTLTRGDLAAGRAQERTSKTVAGLAKDEVAAAGESAKYALAQALEARNITDSNTIAQITGQLYQTALQSQLQWQMFKKQQAYQQKLLEKQQLQGLNAVTENAGQMAYDAESYIDRKSVV